MLLQVLNVVEGQRMILPNCNRFACTLLTERSRFPSSSARVYRCQSKCPLKLQNPTLTLLLHYNRVQNSMSCGTAILFLNCLSLWPACNCSLSIAKVKRSFFCLNCFIFITSKPVKLALPSPTAFPLVALPKLLARPLLVGRVEELESSRPCWRSCLAMRDCSRRSNLSR